MDAHREIYAPRCLATLVAWPPVLVDDTIALKGGVDARYHSYLRQPLSSSLARLAACIARKMARSFLRFLLARWLKGPSFFVFFPGLVLGTIFAGLVAGVALLAGFGFVVFYAIMPPLSSRTVPGDSNSPRTFSLASSSCLYSGGSSN
jgi:hypothetical protein